MHPNPESDALEITQTPIEGDHIGYYREEPYNATMSFVENEEIYAEELQGAWHGMVLPNEENVEVGTPQCQNCEVLPRPMTEAGTLVLRLPHTFSLGKVLAYLSHSGWKHSRRDGLVQIQVEKGQLPLVLSPLVSLLSSPEQRDTDAVYHFAGELPQIQDYFKVESLPSFVAQVRAWWLVEVLRDQSFFSVFQPIVRCDTDGKPDDVPAIFGYECLLRGSHNGRTIAPSAMIDIARASDLIFQLDLAARRCAILGAGAHKITQKVFINFSPNSIYDPWHCLRSTVNTVDEVGLRRDQVVFEITETERLPEIKHLQRLMKFYREEGFQVALDDMGAGYSSLNILVALQPDYVKLDRELVSCVDCEPAKAIVAGKLLETIGELGLSTIAEGIERPEELEWVSQRGAAFAQGYLFARPATPPPGVNVHQEF